MNPNVMTLARWMARNAVKAELRAQGRRPEYEDIGDAVRAYFAQHREALIEQAKQHPPATNSSPSCLKSVCARSACDGMGAKS